MRNVPTMTRGHFVALASALADTRPDEGDPAALAAWTATANAVAAVCRSANPRYSRDRFERAARMNGGAA